ncbi:lytic transglycosylase domain-containing protein [Streptomonospora nanhaiensis]|uniref:aggregation-promoting factor C-terminal-like domain-containing protein n=1 Tax=Streptomonospora nanhaiensis TaxID=1323731 RepID=UPI001C384B34|nr:lytic transglycosylase domain-containing protein [Streptomonospora nanhaiensis]MBV2362864.1 lytic transglycosylase domain-containing protein [Streptomonospora nanhaiensis]MBX9389391.1 lytic transglycosylase domain-containing protein [Streptomonospora nanhaiensis]
MLLNRISLRVAAGVGSAAVVAGAAFTLTAFADQTGPEDTATAVVPDAAGSPDFFAGAQELSESELQQQRDQVRDQIEQVGGTVSGTATTEEEQKEEEPEPEEDGGSSGGGGTTAPAGDPKAIAQGMLADYGWGADQFSCLEPLWEKESGWDHTAQNPSSGAYGIPQALPGNKMATAGADWQTNPATQIEWGLGYIQDRYGSPCGAWEHSQANGWY